MANPSTDKSHIKNMTINDFCIPIYSRITLSMWKDSFFHQFFTILHDTIHILVVSTLCQLCLVHTTPLMHIVNSSWKIQAVCIPLIGCAPSDTGQSSHHSGSSLHLLAVSSDFVAPSTTSKPLKYSSLLSRFRVLANIAGSLLLLFSLTSVRD